MNIWQFLDENLWMLLVITPLVLATTCGFGRFACGIREGGPYLRVGPATTDAGADQ